MLVIFVYFLALFVAGVPACNKYVYDMFFPCGKMFKPHGKKCLFVPPYPATWESANIQCNRTGLQLLTIKTADEMNFHSKASSGTNILTHGMDYWFGLNDRDKEGVYRWSSGAKAKFRVVKDRSGTTTFPPWSLTEPSGTRQENCVLLDHNGRWRDDLCSRRYNFICERSSVKHPLPPGVHVNFHVSPNRVSKGQTLTATCSGFMGQGGRFAWYLIKGSSSRALEKVTTNVKYKKDRGICDKFGTAVVKVRVDDGLAGARLKCCLNDRQGGEGICTRGDVMTVSAEAKKPVLVVQYNAMRGSKLALYSGSQMEGECKAAVGDRKVLHLQLKGPRLEGEWVVGEDAKVKVKTFYDKMMITTSQKQQRTDGLTYEAKFKLNVTTRLQGASILCWSEASATGNPLTSFVNPFEVISLPQTPHLQVFYHADNSEASNGDVLESNCSAVVGENGQLTWRVLVLEGSPHTWRVKSSGPAEMVDDSMCVRVLHQSDETPDGDPRINSTLRIRVSRDLQGAVIACFSYDRTTQGPKQGLGDRTLVARSNSLHVITTPRRPWLLVRPESAPVTYIHRPYQGLCTAALGHPGLLFVSRIQGVSRQKWTVSDNGHPVADMPAQNAELAADHKGRPGNEEYKAVFRICVTRNIYGEKIACSTRVLNPAQFKLNESDPVKIVYLPGHPTLEVSYHQPPNLVSEGEVLEVKCHADVGTGGTLVWQVETSGSKHEWKVPLSGPLKLRDQENCVIISSKLDHTLKLGPSILSTLQVVVRPELQGAKVTCQSYDTEVKAVTDILGRGGMGESSRPLQLTHLPQIPALNLSYSGTNNLSVSCFALVGEGGTLSWVLTSPGEVLTTCVDLAGHVIDCPAVSATNGSLADLDIAVEVEGVSRDPVFGPRIVSVLTTELTSRLREATITCCSLGVPSPHARNMSVTRPLDRGPEETGREKGPVFTVLQQACIAVITTAWFLTLVSVARELLAYTRSRNKFASGGSELGPNERAVEEDTVTLDSYHFPVLLVEQPSNVFRTSVSTAVGSAVDNKSVKSGLSARTGLRVSASTVGGTRVDKPGTRTRTSASTAVTNKSGMSGNTVAESMISSFAMPRLRFGFE